MFVRVYHVSENYNLSLVFRSLICVFSSISLYIIRDIRLIFPCWISALVKTFRTRIMNFEKSRVNLFLALLQNVEKACSDALNCTLLIFLVTSFLSVHHASWPVIMSIRLIWYPWLSGQFFCGNKHCNNKEGLASYEASFIPFNYLQHPLTSMCNQAVAVDWSLNC